MTFNIVVFATRKPGSSPAEFRLHYENEHVLLIKALSAESFPTYHNRHYVDRQALKPNSTDNSNLNFPATVLQGNAEGLVYDAYAELSFRDATHFQAFMASVNQAEHAKRLAEDEERFLDRSMMKVVVIGHIDTTTVTS